MDDPSSNGGLGVLARHLERRRLEIIERIRQLQVRERELSVRLGGSSRDEVVAARTHAERALALARDAHRWAAVRHDRAAEVHLRTAEVLEAFGHTGRAGAHRAAAEADQAHGRADRAAADAASH
jgi:hypothetical protein